MSEIKHNSNSNLGIVVEQSVKFAIQNCSDPGINLSAQNKLAFDIADSFSHSDSFAGRQLDRQVERGVHDELSVQNRQLEKKFNVIIQLLNTLLANLGDEAQLHSVKLSANSLEWNHAEFQNDKLPAVEIGQNLIFDFYPESELSYPIKRCGTIVNIAGSVISANFYPLDLQGQERFEKWVFQLHRRSLQHKDH